MYVFICPCIKYNIIISYIFYIVNNYLKNILIYFANDCGSQLVNGDVLLPNVLTYRIIASFANTSTATVCQTIKKFRENGILNARSRKLIMKKTSLDQLLVVN